MGSFFPSPEFRKGIEVRLGFIVIFVQRIALLGKMSLVKRGFFFFLPPSLFFFFNPYYMCELRIKYVINLTFYLLFFFCL